MFKRTMRNMSAFEVYVIDAAGDVNPLGEVRNPHGAAPHIWRLLSQKYGVADPLSAMNGYDTPLWKLFRSGRLTDDENTLLGFTFDGVWVARENIPRLLTAIERWWPGNRQQWSEFDKKFYEVTPTLEGVAELLRTVPDDARGVCFNPTSVNSNPWSITLTCACPTCGDEHSLDEDRPFNFDKDKMNADGKTPWELFS